MNLIIVESPTKARTLTRFLGDGYTVEASMGHIRDLPKSSLGVDIEKQFAPKYIIPKDKAKHMKRLSDMAQKARQVILATDPDREGEAIAWHISEVLHDRAGEKVQGIQRIVFHEITKEAIDEALKNPRDIDQKLVAAQQARRVLDRLVGYKLSPLLWKKLSKRWLSAGRVQSVAVRLIVEREREIAKFESQPYWVIEGEFSAHGKTIRAILSSHNEKPYEETQAFPLFDGTYTVTKTSIVTEAEAKAIVANLTPPFTASAVERKEVLRYPLPPYTTSTLQQDAGRKLYFSSKRTMQVAQKLYEEGYITYHRTDSVNLSQKFLNEAREYLTEVYGRAYVADKPRQYQTKSKVAQEAHEAIRPTNCKTLAADLKNHRELNRDHVRLYEYIFKRAVASQAKEARIDATEIRITSANKYLFKAQGSVVTFDGFLRIVGTQSEDTVLPPVAVGDTLPLTGALPVSKATNPPPRYTEASLVKTLEEKDIGRPSTYAPIISTIQDRQYVVKEEKKLKPTELGTAVTDFLVRYFSEIIDLPFTATMEESLDDIAKGEKQWVPVISSFYEPFAKKLESTYEQASKVKIAEEEIGEACPTCGNPLVVRVGRFGKFIACSTFPACTYTRQFVNKIGKPCPRCGGDIVYKKSRRGKSFYGCSNYPKCTFAAWKKEDIV